MSVTVNTRPTAGISGSITVCSNNAAFSLAGALGGTPDGGGAWTGPGGGPVSGTYTPGVSVPGTYTYTVLGVPPCAPAIATVDVQQVAAPVPGTDRSITICSDEPPFDLIGQLGGTPAPGGTWVGPDGPHGPQFDPALDEPGAYTYTVLGTAPCANASATLTITVRRAPDAGADASITLCSTDANVALIGALGGSPDAGGAWTGPGGAPHSGTFVPGVSQPGAYTYTVVGLSPCAPAAATVTVTVNTAPVAGVNASVTRCSDDDPFQLFSELGGNPDAGGTWAGPGGAHGPAFHPSVDAPGPYTYTVAGLAPCSNATATVNVTVVIAPQAGLDGDTTVCSNNAPFELFSRLGGAPDPGGSWTAPGGAPHGGTFVPGVDVVGEYRYRVAGQAPCDDDEAVVTVTVVQAPDAGSNGSITVCSDDAPVDLFGLLGGDPDLGGSWTRPSGTSHSGTYLPGVQMGGAFVYTVQGVLPCSAATASVQVTRVIAPNAGVNSSVTVCSTNGPFALLSVLGGNPNGNGAWTDPLGAIFSGTFAPGTSLPGTYTYVVPGSAPCANDTALLTVSVNQAPNAGTNATITVCSADAPFSLTGALGGTPDPGGTWTAPDGGASNGTYVPGTSLAGGYTYVVPGNAPCLNASAVLVVNENRQPVAGASALFERCSTDGPVDLFMILDGTPDPGGTWTGPAGSMSGIFVPGTSVPGDHVYTVIGSAPCVNATATVNATVNQAPDAGVGGGLSVCVDQSSVDLFDGLSGTPDANGTWRDDDGTGQQSGQFFSPLGLPAGDYGFTYMVPGIGQCGDDSAKVIVNVVALLDAGSNGNMSVCRNNAQVDLFAGLGGTPQPGGQWLDLDGTGAVTGQYFNASMVSAGIYRFRYRLTGTVSCASDSAMTTITVVAEPNAGTNGNTSTCSSSPAFSLFPLLGGNPQNGGVWTFNGQPFSGVYDPVLNGSGTYVYTVGGSAPCANATASVTVNEVQAPVAGGSSATTVCSNGGPFNMTLRLSGSPQPGGTWSFGGQSHGDLFVPGLDDPGIYVYTVQGQAPCNPAQATLTITQVPAPNAGTNASATICSTSLPFVLNTLLGGGAQAGGTWEGPSGPNDGVYVPGVSSPGDYFYTVAGLAPCASDVSVVSIFENTAPSAGVSAATTVCAGGPSVNLLSVLGGTPDPTGTWAGPAPGNAPFSGTFVPGTTPAGMYTYTVVGAPPCSTVNSTVTVAVNNPPNAGCSNAISVCGNSQGFAMVDRLACPPDPGGVWTGPAPGNPPFSGIFIPGQSQPGSYTYTVQGASPCQQATATLSIVVTQPANAGANAAISLCNTGGATTLFPLLGPNAQVGGTWTTPGGAIHSGMFLPGVDTPGNYTYTVAGQGSCANASAMVSVVVNQAPNAGCNGLVTICDDQVPFTLYGVLGCAPSPGGQWTAPGGGVHSGIYLPGTDAPGVYTYTIAGVAPCSNAVAQVTVIENQAPNAGQNGFLALCSDQAPVNLFNSIGGQPGTGGGWRAPDGTPFSGTYVPGTSLPGVYTYTLGALAPCRADSAIVTVMENTAPFAGISTVASVCSNTPSFPLVDLLAGTPDLNGTWTFGGAPHGPVFDPAVGGSGAYVYTVSGISPCTNAMAQVQITRVVAPKAGTGGAIAACVDDPAVPLVSGLLGSYDAGGTWSDDDATGQLSGTVFNATGVAPGTYHFTYTVPGQGSCASASATVTVTITEALNAGEDATIAVCEGELVVLFAALGGAPQEGGVWQDLDGSGALIAGGVFNTTLVNDGTTWRFRYVLGASAQCFSDTSMFTVNVVDGPFAGCDGALSLCTTNTPTALINALTCGPDGGGEWFGPSGTPHPGVFLPALDVPGTYRYVVPGVGTCPPDTARVIVQLTQAVNAGNNAAVSICSSDPSVALFPLLGPNAQEGGAWMYNNASHPGVYNPAIHAPGVYTYRVPGAPPCADALATVTVTEPQAPNAGCNASVGLCSAQAPINMRLSLGCAPQAGGTWMGPNGAHGEFFDPASDVPGAYVYTVSGTSPCADASATLVIGVTEARDPGQSTTLTACLGQSTVDLFQALGSTAQPGGIWTDVTGSGAMTGGVFDPGQAGTGQWSFTYGFPSSGPCPAASSQVVVTVVTGSVAGADSSVTICGAVQTYQLFEGLAGTPDPGGVWTDQLGTGALGAGGILNVIQLPVGTTAPYTYTITDVACGNVSATVFVTTAAFPDPGEGSSLFRCVDDASVDLFPRLSGTPDIIGHWFDPSGQLHGGTFVPGTDQPGPYTYTVQGDGVCPDSSAVLMIHVDMPPDPGEGGVLFACDTLQALDLHEGLGGEPGQDGVWSSSDVSGQSLEGGTLNTSVLIPGAYALRYTVSNPGCGSAWTEVTVTVAGGVVVRDVGHECNDKDRTYVLSFVIEEGDASSYIVSGSEGTLTGAAGEVFTSVPLFISEAYDILVSDRFACGVVRIVGESPCTYDDDVFTPRSFSPNGDGINDAFVIPGIEGYPLNSIEIFNRWGARMYRASGYDNRSVVWDGTSSDGAYAGTAPAGTYYYVLDLGNGKTPLTGYVYLNR